MMTPVETKETSAFECPSETVIQESFEQHGAMRVQWLLYEEWEQIGPEK